MLLLGDFKRVYAVITNELYAYANSRAHDKTPPEWYNDGYG